MRSELDPGSTVASYRIKGVLGRGGMGIVYRAEHIHLRREVALKVIAPDQAANEDFRRRFIDEYETAAAIDHPHIIPIYDAGPHDDLLFIAMRLVRGTDLRTLLSQEYRLPVQTAVAIVAQVASALDAAHLRGLIHRDVKPANILIERRPSPSLTEHCWLSDFGLVKVSDVLSGVTRSGHILGTLPYVSPEQIRADSESLDGRADLYSLACVFYECLTGAVPFDKGNDVSLIYAHLHEQPPAVSAVRPELPPALDKVIARAMAKHVDDRYPTCTAFAEDVQRQLPGKHRTEAPTATALAPHASESDNTRSWLQKGPSFASEPPPGPKHRPIPVAIPPTFGDERSGAFEGRRRRAALLAVVAGIAVAAVVAAVFFRPLFAGVGSCPSTADEPGVGFEGTKIAFVSNRDGNDEIYVMDPDGGGVERVTNDPLPDRAPAWAPDGRSIAFVRDTGSSTHLFRMSCDGTGVQQLTRGMFQYASPAWSPDGKRIAFEREQRGNSDIFLMNADGSGKRNLSAGSALDESDPAWSSDGKRLAFVARSGGNLTILVVDATARGSADVIPRQSGQNIEPAWFDSQIAFSSDRSNTFEIYSMNEDGTAQTILTLGPGEDVAPDWAPDGSKIVFESDRDGNSEIYVMNADGRAQTNLTNSQARDTSPAWSRGSRVAPSR